MKRLITFALLSFTLFSTVSHASERAQVGWQWIKQGALVVDVRTPQEFQAGHLDNAVNYPLAELHQHFDQIAKDQTVVVYCRSGNRSGQAMQYLKAQGFNQVHNAGGLNELLNTSSHSETAKGHE
ncbi:rhodanese-like domain-containing protein [Vibrio sp. JPW-9-11-11]|uniref:rhodanese-like domain-containing protein n=1 Tax=Vibrio sp. JPW-9-11-11 TaxID=1416532 RepID=UPI0015949C68|nr:rhodanese-like domain-containing protein [Vibrio sp. JPW-9-11-11]NVD08590.1 rhodanese-like domain-containing protein [Vibrio sp. JPW-9-11-11]